MEWDYSLGKDLSKKSIRLYPIKIFYFYACIEKFSIDMVIKPPSILMWNIF